MIFLFGFFLWILFVPVCKEANLEVAGTKNMLFFSRPNYVSSILKSGCKESQFYSLPFGQALASLYLPK